VSRTGHTGKEMHSLPPENDTANPVRLNVGRLAHIPESVLNVAAIQSRNMEQNLRRKKLVNMYVYLSW
jgi:hypothetical protein